MNIIFEVIFKNLAINYKVNWFFSSCSIVVNILILPFKDPFYYANENNWKTWCLRERAAFLPGNSCTCFSSEPPPLHPLAAKLHSAIRVAGVGSLNFDSRFLCDLLSFLPSSFSPPGSQHANGSCTVALTLLPRGQAGSLETVMLHSSQLLRDRCWSHTYSTAEIQILLGGLWWNTLSTVFF